MDGIMTDGRKIPWEDLLALCNRKEEANKRLREEIRDLRDTLEMVNNRR